MTRQTHKRLLTAVMLLCLFGLFQIFAQAQSLPRWSPNTHIPIVASSFNDKERERIKSAIEAWRPLLPKGLTISSADTGNVTIIRQATKGDELGETTLQPDLNGVTLSAVVHIDPRAGSGDEFQQVVEHEIGHLLGLDHRPKSVMQKQTRDSFWIGFWQIKSKAYHPGEEDRLLLSALYPVPISRPVAVAVAATNVLQSEPPPVPILATAASQRYSVRRIVTIRDKSGVRLVRSSTLTFNNRSEQIETDVIQTGEMKGVNEAYWKAFPVFPICETQTLNKFSTGLRAPLDYTVFWIDEDSDVSIASKSGERFQSGDLPWFAERVPSGLSFPIYAESKDGRVSARFYNYRLFRTSVAITPLER